MSGPDNKRLLRGLLANGVDTPLILPNPLLTQSFVHNTCLVIRSADPPVLILTDYLTNIFESFLPQLLAYPNPIDPLNGDAAAMYLHRPEEYKQKIKEYIQKYATEEALKEQEEGTGDSSSESSMSDFSEDEAQDMEL
ncbi:hypothetical protein CB1_000757012 [Camelus ferus]|nr:hypothetical protein CB1_000757012 [Camelus ferus]